MSVKFVRITLTIALTSLILISLISSAHAATYTLNVNAVCKVQNNIVNCVPPFPGSAVNSSGQIQAGSSIHLSVTSPSYTGTPPGVRWVLDGYLLWRNGQSQTAQPVNSNSFDLVMDSNYDVTWVWHEELNITLTSNYGSPALTGAGWVQAGAATQISTPQIFFIENTQYLFQKWAVLSGNVTLTNPNSPTTTVAVNSVPVVEAMYALVSVSMTNTYTTTITTIVSGSTVTTTSTGIFSHSTVTVQLQISNSALKPSLLYGANVTVTDDAGVRVFGPDLTDVNGLTKQFTLYPQQIYTVHVQYLSNVFTARTQFPTSETYQVNINQGGPISFEELKPYIIPILLITVAVVALIVYFSGRRKPEEPRWEWGKS